MAYNNGQNKGYSGTKEKIHRGNGAQRQWGTWVTEKMGTRQRSTKEKRQNNKDAQM